MMALALTATGVATRQHVPGKWPGCRNLQGRQIASIADVAREVGVSMMTVSRVIQWAWRRRSAATRQRVLEVVERLGYRPSSIARGLATRHTGTLGLVVPDIANPFFAEVARGVEEGAYAQGYNVFLCNTDEDPARELDVLGFTGGETGRRRRAVQLASR